MKIHHLRNATFVIETGKVIANHLETLNHCPATRIHLEPVLAEKGPLSKVIVPDDGESFSINAGRP